MVCNNVSVSQFTKLPALLQHYREHQQGNRQIGFFDFLAMHYWCHNRHDSDDERHRQLPFKDHTIVYSVYYKTTACRIQVTKPSQTAAVVYLPINEKVHLQTHLNALFKPPKTLA